MGAEVYVSPMQGPVLGYMRSRSVARKSSALPIWRRLVAFAAAFAALTSFAFAQEPEHISVGSKKFTESYVLGEIAKRLLATAGFAPEHKQGIGATSIVWEALKSGDIDVYPEYTGTVKEEILKLKGDVSDEQMNAELGKFGIAMSKELGFNNTYALVMRKAQAEQFGIKTISDLRSHPDLRVKVSSEFLKRKDGWEPLAAKYGLQFNDVAGIDHGLAYAALAASQIDLTDAYSTDAQIGQYNLYTLVDDLKYFPQYKAVFLYRKSLPPKAVEALNSLGGKIDEPLMIQLNGDAEKSKDFAHAANLFFERQPMAAAGAAVKPLRTGKSMWPYLFKLARQHLLLVGLSMACAILVGVWLGIIASRPGLVSHLILGITGIVQTIPSLALLALLVPLAGISLQTAIVALFLYSLLPIVRNTATGLQDIPPSMRESAAALGLTPSAQLFSVFLPMASRSILAGIKTSTIINIGTATLAALIAQGGFGEPIVSGLAINDSGTILQGAIPAAALALIVGWIFDLLDRVLIPRGLRLTPSRD